MTRLINLKKNVFNKFTSVTDTRKIVFNIFTFPNSINILYSRILPHNIICCIPIEINVISHVYIYIYITFMKQNICLIYVYVFIYLNGTFEFRC